MQVIGSIPPIHRPIKPPEKSLSCYTVAIRNKSGCFYLDYTGASSALDRAQIPYQVGGLLISEQIGFYLHPKAEKREQQKVL